MKTSVRLVIGAVACLVTLLMASIILIPSKHGPARLSETVSELVRFADCAGTRRPTRDPMPTPGASRPIPCLMV